MAEGYQQRAAPPYGDGESTTSAFSDRYPAPRYHSKSVIAAAGLTVDLPSPDSGIGADAVTPRDHTAVQQVGERIRARAGRLHPLYIYKYIHHNIYISKTLCT